MREDEMKNNQVQGQSVARRPFEVRQKSKKGIKKVLVRIVAFNVINMGLVVAIVVLLGKLSMKASEVKMLKNKNALGQELTDVAVLRAEIKSEAENISRIESVFVDENSFLQFLDEKDRLQAGGLVSDFSVSDKVVRDARGNKGYALLIEFRGGVNEVVQALSDLQKLPFLMETASLEVSVLRDEGQLRVKYIGFLHVNE